MERQTAREIVEQLYQLAQHVQDPDLLLQAHMARGTMLCVLGELVAARDHLEQAIALYDPQHHRSHAFRYSLDPGVTSLSRASWTLWMLGYPDQARRRSQEALTLARELAHANSLAMALYFAAVFHQFCREARAVQELTEATVALATEQGLAQRRAAGTFLWGWALDDAGTRRRRAGADASGFDDLPGDGNSVGLAVVSRRAGRSVWEAQDRRKQA